MPRFIIWVDSILNQRYGTNLSITGQDSSVPKSNQLQVDVFRFPFLESRYTLETPLKQLVNFTKS